MKILYLHDYSFRVNEAGGIGFEVGMPITYFERFTNAGFSIEILSRKHFSSKGEFISKGSITISKHGARNYLGILKNIFIMIFSKKEYDLYVVNYPSVTGLIFLSLFHRRCNYILEHVNDDNSFETKTGGFILSFLLKRFKKTFFSGAYGITSVSDYLVNKYYPSNYMVASNVNVAVPEFIFRPIPVTTPLKLISVGAVSKKKGIDLAIQRMKELDIECEYYIAGGAGDLNLKELTSDLPKNIKVVYLGMLDKKDIYEYLSNSHIFIQPSRSEGLPRALIEGIAYSLPAIVSTLPCFSELIDPSYIIDWNIEGSLKMAINHILSSDNFELQSFKNYNTSLKFDNKILTQKKNEFYEGVFNELHASRKS